jgi:hypothetical protein
VRIRYFAAQPIQECRLVSTCGGFSIDLRAGMHAPTACPTSSRVTRIFIDVDDPLHYEWSEGGEPGGRRRRNVSLLPGPMVRMSNLGVGAGGLGGSGPSAAAGRLASEHHFRGNIHSHLRLFSTEDDASDLEFRGRSIHAG